MEIFLDSSDIKEIRGLNKANLVDGITTNPSLLASANTIFKFYTPLGDGSMQTAEDQFQFFEGVFFNPV